jgi:hypothetical protein
MPKEVRRNIQRRGRQLNFDWQAFGKAVKAWRDHNGLSLRECNWDKSAIWRVEAGYSIKAPTLLAIAEAIGEHNLFKYLY